MSLSLSFSELYCTYCGLPYDKENKPKTMPCSHNICQKCHGLNRKRMKCIICGKSYLSKGIRKFPINFLLFEVIERAHDENEMRYLKEAYSGRYYYECKECSIKMTRYSLHQENFSSHSLLVCRLYTDNEEIEVIKKSCNDLYEHYTKFNEGFNANVLGFINNLHDLLQKDTHDYFKDTDLYTKLQMCGIINSADRQRLQSFTKLNTNQAYLSIVNSSQSFNDFITSINESKEAIGYSSNEVLSLWFYYTQLKETKLTKSNIEGKLSQLKTLIANDNNYSHNFYEMILSKSFCQIKKIIIGNQSTPSYFLINNRIYYYSIPDAKFLIIRLPLEQEELLKNHHYENCISFNSIFYFTSNDFPSFSYSIDNNEIAKIPKFKSPKINYSIISALGMLFAIGKNSTEGLDLKTESLSEWTTFSSIDFNTKPDLLLYDHYVIYAFDSLTVLHKYELLRDKWTTLPLKESALLSLSMNNVTNYALVYCQGDILVYGGYNHYLKQPNDNIIMIDHEKKKIKLKEKHQFLHGKEGLNAIAMDDDDLYVISYENGMFKVYKKNSREQGKEMGYAMIGSNSIDEIV